MKISVKNEKEERKKGENCIKDGGKVIKNASFWVIINSINVKMHNINHCLIVCPRSPVHFYIGRIL